MSGHPAVQQALRNAYFDSVGLPRLTVSLTRLNRIETAVYGPVRTVVWEGRSRKAPPYPDQRLSSPAAAAGETLNPDFT